MIPKVDRFDRSRRITNICLTVIVGVTTSATVAAIIYFYYSTRRF
ncbi:MAG TPA: hypothetical protein VFZ59_06010 [Verrucomicrobiae bacterium]|nr:hypothetical protein [Verrucomicrobiae bacterium]